MDKLTQAMKMLHDAALLQSEAYTLLSEIKAESSIKAYMSKPTPGSIDADGTVTNYETEET